jgi:hypothetical protein
METSLSANNKICVYSVFYSLSLVNLKNQNSEDILQCILMLVFIFIVIIFLQVYRWWSRKVINEVNREDITADDFTIFVQNLPITNLSSTFEKDLETFFSS